MISDKDAKEYLEAVVNKTAFSGKNKMEEDCQYLDIFGKCKATTHKTCRGCRFYSPTLPAKIKILAQYGIDRDNENNKLVKKLDIKDQQIAMLKEELSNAMEKVSKIDELAQIMDEGNRNADVLTFPYESRETANDLMDRAVEIIQELTGKEWEFTFLTF